ncbi:hypothetical protein DTO164E3_5177 [Paecilomyces variotii]|nr:hypothetical protein DTO164E3_5177 [Paecilomyces variotii]KAJ9360831.1 hypothetical protein DTO027B9_1225 [Paecilomyces variotii]
MIDHVLGRPSTQFRKIQVLAVVSFWSFYLYKGNKHGPPGLRSISARLGSLTPWRTMVLTLLYLYVSRNFAKLVGLECPEPLANLYSRSYFRATWITTGLDAGFWTAMKIKPKWLRDIASLVFTVYYLIAAEQADEKVRRVRATLTVDHMRVAWNKATTPYLSVLSNLMRPRFTKYPPRAIRIPRPRDSSYKEPVNAWLYFDGPLSALRSQKQIVLDIPGGGFVAMNPRTADDKLLAWAGRLGLPILSLDYKKAPEYPYPYALNECYDVYHMIVMTRGRCLGLSGATRPRIVVTGDSAGGNLATGLTLMILQSGSTDTRRWQGEEVLQPPDGLVLIYPALDMNAGTWMSEEQMALIRDRSTQKRNENILRRKTEDYERLTPATTPHQSDEEIREIPPIRDYFEHKASGHADGPSKILSDESRPKDIESQALAAADNQPTQIRTRLAVSSMISYFNDRILTPEMMRAMIILYIGPYNRPDFSTDFLLSPVLASETLLARFPKTYFLTGERDPLVDDTVIFAGRLRQAKLHRFRERQELGLEKSHAEFNEKDHVEVSLIPGISHGFLQFALFFPDGWKHINRCAKSIQDIFDMAEEKEQKQSAISLRSLCSRSGSLRGNSSSKFEPGPTSEDSTPRHHRRTLTGDSSADEDRPLEIKVGKFTPITQSDGSASGSKSSLSNFTSDVKVNSRTPSTSTSTNGVKRNSISLEKNDNKNTTNNNRSKTPQVGAGAGADQPRDRPTMTARDKARSFSLSLALSSKGESDRIDSLQTSIKRDKSLVSLPSEEDLLGRRMSGLAGGLSGVGEEARTP